MATATKSKKTAKRSATAHLPLPKVGGSFTKTYKGKDIKVTVVADGFKIGSKTYPSLTAAAQAVRDSESAINGWAFFGLVKPKVKAGQLAASREQTDGNQSV